MSFSPSPRHADRSRPNEPLYRSRRAGDAPGIADPWPFAAGATLATGGGDLYNAARIWDAETGQERAKLIGGHLHELTGLIYSPNGRRVLTGSADPAGATEGVIRCWDATSGEEVFDFSGCLEE